MYDLNLHPLYWNGRVLTAGPPGESLKVQSLLVPLNLLSKGALLNEKICHIGNVRCPRLYSLFGLIFLPVAYTCFQIQGCLGIRTFPHLPLHLQELF